MAGFSINHHEIDKFVREIKKSIEQAAQRHQVKVPVGASLPDGFGTHSSIEDDPYLSKALLWLDERAVQEPGYVQDLVDFAEREQVPQGEAKGLALQLEQHGLVRSAQGLVPSAEVFLTDDGRIEVWRLKKLAGDRVRRANYSCNAFLRWLYDQDAPIEPAEFAHAHIAFFAGTALTIDEIAGAVAELIEHGLAESEAARDDNDPYRLCITAAGTACIRSGHPVRSYMDSQNTAGTTTNNYGNVINGGMSGGVVSTGDHNTINGGNGIDAQALANLVHGLREVAPQLGLDDVDAEDYTAEVETLERDGHDPEQGGRIWRRIVRLAGPALTTAVATGAGQQLVALGAGLYS
ncbi:hypothetical protein C7C46_26935 [Streptomyces tateyamensis]|uniref:Uncharacterized protein n=1 Tax=Streptomyces tateyamensis TaxID=565073 RepID=A0A2V4N742_9ACTN|nr:hypothetical protein [Streptomyces tateyamensis]PYC71023.1 hypothetical protein C7C46_26935 [Streptomyces tateyamensis]